MRNRDVDGCIMRISRRVVNDPAPQPNIRTRNHRSSDMGFFKAFNSLQITALFSAMPFLVGWLWTATFAGAVALAWVSLIAYIVFFVLMCGAVLHSIDD